jgi:hypothetical protein
MIKIIVLIFTLLFSGVSSYEANPEKEMVRSACTATCFNNFTATTGVGGVLKKTCAGSCAKCKWEYIQPGSGSGIGSCSFKDVDVYE